MKSNKPNRTKNHGTPKELTIAALADVKGGGTYYDMGFSPPPVKSDGTYFDI